MKSNRKERVLLALEQSLGIVTPACKEVGISRDTFYKWKRDDENFRKRIEEIDEMQGDFVEHQLFKKIKEGSERSILFYMKYKGAKKGYSDELNINANVKTEQPLLMPLDFKLEDDESDYDDEDEDKD